VGEEFIKRRKMGSRAGDHDRVGLIVKKNGSIAKLNCLDDALDARKERK